MNTFNRLFTKCFILVCLALLFQGCNSSGELEEIATSNQPTPQAAFGCPTPMPECQGHIEYPVCHTIISQGHSANQTFDIVIRVDSLKYPCLPHECQCREVHYCVKLGFPPLAVTRAAKVSIEDSYENFVTLQYNGKGSYVGQENPLNLDFGNHESGPPTQPYIHEICFKAGEQIMFNLSSIFLSQYDVNNISVSAGGLCIITDIHNPGRRDTAHYALCNN